MKILAKGQNIVRLIKNDTLKIRQVEIRDGKDIAVAVYVLQPNVCVDFGMSFSNDIRVSGKGSRDAWFDGYNIRFDDNRGWWFWR